MNNKGYEIHIISSPDETFDTYSSRYEFIPYGVSILRKFSLFKDIAALYKVCKYIRINRFQVVVGHTPKGALIGLLAAFLLRVPIRIYFRHGLVYETMKGINRMIFKTVERITAGMSTKVVCVSPSLGDKSLKDRLNPGHKQLHLSKGTCNGIDIEKFNRNNIDPLERKSLLTQLNISQHSFIVGFCGRLVVDKGIIELVKAFKSLQSEHNDLYLLLVGFYDNRDGLPRDIVYEIETNSHIINPGFVDHEKINLYYSIMDIFILPSFREGFGMSILEASAMGIPVITTRITGCIDAIVENETGIFVSNTEKSIKNALSDLIRDSKKRDYLGKNGRNFVELNFDPIKIWNEIEMLYH
ncbi:MAG: glycosyltransferase family 4 protein [Prolixibacteraceae bacterium]